MWAILKVVFAQWAIWKLLLKSVGTLAWLVPLAFILKAVGLPILILLGVLALPLLLVLLVFGLPIILVLMMGGVLLTATMALLSFGVIVLKIAIPIAIIWVLLRWLFRSSGDAPGTPPGTSAGTPPGTTTATDGI